MRNSLTQLAQASRLLIASDFDGTLAPIVAHPDQASPVPGVMDTLRRAARLPQTCVAIISGRSITDLNARMGQIEGAWLVGGHGAEIQGPNIQLAPEGCELALDMLAEQLRAVAPPEKGFLHERKPASIALHFRNVPDSDSKPALLEVERLASGMTGVRKSHGKMVVELMVVDADKGGALCRIQHATGATGTFFVGDDVTDEDAFKRMSERDLAVKIGAGKTYAHEKVATIEDAHVLLAALVDAREAWLRSITRPSLEQYSVLSDQRTLAVVSPSANVEWFCLPRIDGGSIFSSLLDGESMGFWSISPASGETPTGQRYRDHSFTIETTWPTMRVLDYLDGSGGRTFQRAGRSDLVRVIEGQRGGGRARVVLAPRLDYGRARTKIIPVEQGLIVDGAADPLVLFSPGVEWSITEEAGNETATAEIDLSGEPVVLELRAGTRSLVASRIPEATRRAQTERAWTVWAESLVLPPIATDLCRRSAQVLRALSYGPTGAMVAAGTTSLPESAGGERNWDYRFCWPRDAAVACAALVGLGNTGVAMRYLDWLLGVVDRCAGPERLRPIYTVDGTELGAEAELSHLSGYRASRPVRIGNAAARQVQIDVFGPIVQLIYTLAEAGAAISIDHWRLVDAMVTAVERTWHDPDHGIWEVRTDKHHHVHSKAMCWLALDRAVKLAEQFGAERREAWAALRDRIRDEVLERGYERRLGGFVAAYDRHEPDAAALAVGLTGLIDPDDSRFRGTVRLVQDRLLEGGTVYRYRYDDGIPGPEGGFHLCTGWLIESLVLIGERDEAKRLFDSLCASAGATGMMTEQWCPKERIGLGNTPQAYSHAAIINSALVLSAGGI